jgi:hypothetical protein
VLVSTLTQAMAAATATHSSFLQLQKYNAPEWASALKLVVRDMAGNGMRAAVAAAEAELLSSEPVSSTTRCIPGTARSNPEKHLTVVCRDTHKALQPQLLLMEQNSCSCSKLLSSIQMATDSCSGDRPIKHRSCSQNILHAAVPRLLPCLLQLMFLLYVAPAVLTAHLLLRPSHRFLDPIAADCHPQVFPDI